LAEAAHRRSAPGQQRYAESSISEQGGVGGGIGPRFFGFRLGAFLLDVFPRKEIGGGWGGGGGEGI
jgi:hypothetical protein